MKRRYQTPIWRLNSEASECAACHMMLESMALPRAMRERSDPGQRHHCRWCGDIYCGNCTQGRAVVRNGELGRVCTACSLELGRPNGLRLDPFVAAAVALSPFAGTLPAPLSSIATEPVLLSRSAALISSLLAVDELTGTLLWSVLAIGLMAVLKELPVATMALISCCTVGDVAAFALSLSAAHSLSTGGHTVGTIAATAASLCLLYSLMAGLRRLTVGIAVLLERAGEGEEEEEGATNVYRILGGESMARSRWFGWNK